MDIEIPSPSRSDISDANEKEITQMLTHTIVSAPESNYTLEHRRQTPGEKKLIYCIRFDPDDNKYLAIGSLAR